MAKLALDAGGVAVGGTSKGVTSSLLLAVALMLIGEGLVILYRVQDSLPRPTAGSGGAAGRGGASSGGLLGGFLDAGRDGNRQGHNHWDDRSERNDWDRDRRRH